MHVIRHTTRCQQGAVPGPENSADVVEQARLEILSYERRLILRGENQVIVEASE